MKRIISLIGICLIIIASIFYTKRLIDKRKKVYLETNKIEYTLKNMIGYNYYNENDIYDAIISIPLIKLKKGLYKINDVRNNIEENIMVDKHSTYPNTPNSNTILIAHSGYGEKAYFKDLDKLNNDSLLEFYYNHTKYIYKVDNYYLVDKTGKVKINRDDNKTTLTLITCKGKDKQIVYIAYLIDQVEY